MPHEIVFIGGPKHGERWAMPGDAIDASQALLRCELVYDEYKDLIYRLQPLADTPGALAYVYAPQEEN